MEDDLCGWRYSSVDHPALSGPGYIVLHPSITHGKPPGRGPCHPIRRRPQTTNASGRLDQKLVSLDNTGWFSLLNHCPPSRGKVNWLVSGSVNPGGVHISYTVRISRSTLLPFFYIIYSVFYFTSDFFSNLLRINVYISMKWKEDIDTKMLLRRRMKGVNYVRERESR